MSTLVAVAVLFGIIFLACGGLRQEKRGEALLIAVFFLINLGIFTLFLITDHYIAPHIIIILSIFICSFIEEKKSATDAFGYANLSFLALSAAYTVILFIPDIFHVIQWIFSVIQWIFSHLDLLFKIAIGLVCVGVVLYILLCTNLFSKPGRRKEVSDEKAENKVVDDPMQEYRKRSREQYQKEKRASSEHKHTHTGPCKSSTEGASRRYNSEIQNILNRYILKSENRIVLDGIHDVDGKYAGIPENDPASWSAYGDAIMAYPPDLDRKDVCEVIYYALGKYRVALLFGSEPAYYEKFLDTALDFLGKSFECRGDTARMARVVDECNALFDERKSVFMHHDAVTRKLYRMNGMLAYNNVLSSPELKNKYGKRASCYEEYAGDALHEKHTRDGQGGRHSPGGAGESGVRESAPRIDDAAVLAGMKAVDEKYAGIKAGERNAYVAYGDELMQYAARVGGKAACGVMYCALEKYRVALRSGSEPVYYEKFLDAALDFIGESFEYGGDTARVAGVVDECNALFDEKKPSFLNNQAVLKKLYDMNSGLSYVDESDASLQKYRKRAAYYEELGGGW